METEDARSAPPRGMRRKPRWIYAFAICFILAPFFNFGLALWAAGVQRWYVPSTWKAWLPFITMDSWVVSFLTFLAGVMLLFVRRISFWFALAILGIVMIQSLSRWPQWSQGGSLLGIGALAVTLGIVALFYFSDFRQPYLNPRIRWWETSPRFKVEFDIKVQEWPHQGILLDISRTGALIEWKHSSEIPQIDGSTLITIKDNLSLPAFVARKTQLGYGLRFEKLDGDEKRGLRRFLEQLASDPLKVKR